MSRVLIQLPRVLCELVDCAPRIPAEGATVGEALTDLVRTVPALEGHLFQEGGALRRHILCFWNQTQARKRAELDEPLTRGDILTLVNSVAGG